MDSKSCVFPLFLNLENRDILVVGSGKIATRRIKSLLRAKCNITVVSISDLEKELTGQVTFIKDIFSKRYVSGKFLVLGATDSKDVNYEIYRTCRAENILVNICDDPSLCDFYFPAIFENDDIIGGVTSKNGNKHSLVKEVASKIRGVL